MRNKLILTWNYLLGLLAFLLLYVVGSNVAVVFRGLDGLPEGGLKDRTQMMVFQGIGVLLLIALGAFSLSSFFWNRKQWFYRIPYVAFLLVSIIGVYFAVQADKSDSLMVAYASYTTFMIYACVMAFPILVFGQGYPALINRFFRRFSEVRLGDQAESVESDRSDE